VQLGVVGKLVTLSEREAEALRVAAADAGRSTTFCRNFKPSDGLEPSTPSLPSSDEAGSAGTAGKPRARKPREKKESAEDE
jgi:hypothetical protein